MKLACSPARRFCGALFVLLLWGSVLAGEWKFPCPEDKIASYTAYHISEPINIDGRLEESTGRPDKKPKHHAAEIASEEGENAPAKDWLWIGRRPNANPKKTSDRFRGDLDELFLADRALAPREIVHLMTTNTLRQPKMIAAE